MMVMIEMKVMVSNNELSGDVNSFVIFEINNMMVKIEESGVMLILDYIEMVREEKREIVCVWYYGYVCVIIIVLCIYINFINVYLFF